jgi:hypothetical protein
LVDLGGGFGLADGFRGGLLGLAEEETLEVDDAEALFEGVARRESRNEELFERRESAKEGCACSRAMGGLDLFCKGRGMVKDVANYQVGRSVC